MKIQNTFYVLSAGSFTPRLFVLYPDQTADFFKALNVPLTGAVLFYKMCGMKNKKITFMESLMLIAGAGIGTGILTLPYAIGKIGVWGTLVALTAAYVVSISLYFIIADLTLNSIHSSQLLGILQEHLFTGRQKKLLSSIFFILLALLLLENLIVYILCAANVLTELFGLHTVLSKLVFYLLASVVMFFGIKGVGLGEKYSVALISVVIIVLAVLSLHHVKNTLSFRFGEPNLVFAIYGLFMFAFSAIFAVIQVCNYIESKEDIKKALVGGLTLNAGLTVIFAAAVILGSEEITEVSTIGLANSLGIPFVRIICSLFVLFAMFSSYWSSGLAFADAAAEQFRISRKGVWLISTLPSVLMAIALPMTIINYVQLGAGALSVILIIVVIPAYWNAVRKSEGTLLLRNVGKSKIFLWIMGVMIFLMAISSLVPIN